MSDKRLTLKELKALVKEYVKSTPKMSSGKDKLLLFAHGAGLLNKKDMPEVKESKEKTKPLPKALQKPVKEVKKPKELPEALQKPKKSSKKVVESESESEEEAVSVKVSRKSKKVEEAPKKREPSGFAKFMSENKGQGYSMKDLSAMYKDRREDRE